MELTRDAAREDVAQLITLLTESHPDPYSACGGPVAFHRQAREIFAAIPDAGLSEAALLRLLRPLVASIRDGHTRIGLDTPAEPRGAGLWLEWEVIERELYVAAVYHPDDAELLGARLRAVDGMPVDELLARMGHLQGFDNEYQNLLHLASALGDPPLLAELLGRDTLPDALHVALLPPDDSARLIAIPVGDETPGARITSPTTLRLPELNAAEMGWGFLDARREVAYVRADSLMRYREAFEFSASVGSMTHLDLHLAETARRACSGDLPDSVAERIALVPSATDLLRGLFAAMRDARSAHLLVDLRFCPGGNSLFALMLGYCLYGAEAVAALDDGYQVKRYSPLYLANRLTTRREELATFFQNGGYDFTEEESWQRMRQNGLTAEERERRMGQHAAFAAHAPTFGHVYAERQDEALWTPHVVVLTAARTYSAAFDVAALLAQAGADVVGVPSAQAGNCFIDMLPYTLAHSGLQGMISHKWSRMFPDAPTRGAVLWPTHELTYSYLAQRGFDPHASVTLALERLERSR